MRVETTASLSFHHFSALNQHLSQGLVGAH